MFGNHFKSDRIVRMNVRIAGVVSLVEYRIIIGLRCKCMVGIHFMKEKLELSLIRKWLEVVEEWRILVTVNYTGELELIENAGRRLGAVLFKITKGEKKES